MRRLYFIEQFSKEMKIMLEYHYQKEGWPNCHLLKTSGSNIILEIQSYTSCTRLQQALLRLIRLVAIEGQANP